MNEYISIHYNEYFVTITAVVFHINSTITHTPWPAQASCANQALLFTCHKARACQCFWCGTNALMLQCHNKPSWCTTPVPAEFVWCRGGSGQGEGRQECGWGAVWEAGWLREGRWSRDVAVRPDPSPCPRPLWP